MAAKKQPKGFKHHFARGFRAGFGLLLGAAISTVIIVVTTACILGFVVHLLRCAN